MDYYAIYKEKLSTADKIAAEFENGWSIATDIAASIPDGIIRAMHDRSVQGKYADIRLHTLLDVKPYELLNDPDVRGITPISWFSGGGLRRSINAGRADILPCYYRDMPALFEEYINIDAFILAVSPMNVHGFFSVGVVGSNSEALLSKAKHIYVEVNKKMPFAINAPMIHVSQVQRICENEAELPILKGNEPDEISRKIGGYIADEIPNESTLQLGIGAIPEAVGFFLKSKRNLGIHTELFTDSMMELIECGAVTNRCKPIHTGKTVATLAFGSQRMYDYIHNNPSVELLPVNYVNNPIVIAQHPNFISVNAALEVDLFGQVCAESIGSIHVSGTGGQADYVRGANLSNGGKSFIAFPSTAKHGRVSRIKNVLSEGAIVSTHKNDVDMIVTEYGIAKLRGKTLSQRAKALIGIAHPDFRDKLTYEAKQRNIMI